MNPLTVLRYNEFDPMGLTEQIDRVEAALREGNFRAADAKKLIGTGFYRAKLNDDDRLLFTFAKYNGRKLLLVLEVIRHHNYSRSRFLNGAAVDETKLDAITTVDTLVDDAIPSLGYLNPRLRPVHLLDKIISFDEAQDDAFMLRPPLILIGSAGSGKTVLVLEKLKQLTGNILYVTLSPYLSENARNLYFSNGYENDNQSINFLSYREFLETIHISEGSELTYRAFADWFNRHRYAWQIKETHQVFEEIHGVLTGSAIHQPFLSREDYLHLGVRQSIFPVDARNMVYDIFTKYLEFLKTDGFYNPNMVAYQYLERAKPTYDFVVVDEVQDLTNVKLFLILKTLYVSDHFVLSGDANQIVHPNFFSWSEMKSMFYKEQQKDDRPVIFRVLHANYRSSPQVTQLANRLLCLKQARFGSIDKESNYLVRPASDQPGEIRFLPDDTKLKEELNAKTARSARTAVIVMREEDKAEAKNAFKTPLIFSIQEAKGLEYETVILLNVVTNHAREFDAMTDGVTEDDLVRDELKYARAKEKEDKSLDRYKFFINAFYVAMTRSMRNLYLIERASSNRFLRLLGLSLEKEGITLKGHVSSQEEWNREARRLERQGKKEQAEDIRRVILAQKAVGWSVLTPQNLETLKKEALDSNHYNRQAKLLLFEYAVLHHVPSLLSALVEHHFNAAKQPFDQKKSIEQKHYNDYLTENFREIKRKIDLYGIDYRNPFNQTPLMLAALFGRDSLARWLIQNGATPHLTDNWGRTPLLIALRQAYQSNEFAKAQIGRLYETLAPACIKVKMDDRMIKLDNKQMEFFLVHSMLAMLQEILRVKIKQNLPAFQTADFVSALLYFPDNIIPPHRKKRAYLSAILARNELNRNDQWNRKLFLRVRRGHYILNPRLELDVEGRWINLYDLVHITELEKEVDNATLQSFIKFVRSKQTMQKEFVVKWGDRIIPVPS